MAYIIHFIVYLIKFVLVNYLVYLQSMKRLLLITILLTACIAARAQNYSTPGVPASTTTFTPTFRFKAATPDSAASPWLSIGNKWYKFPTFVQLVSGYLPLFLTGTTTVTTNSNTLTINQSGNTGLTIHSTDGADGRASIFYSTVKGSEPWFEYGLNPGGTTNIWALRNINGATAPAIDWIYTTDVNTDFTTWYHGLAFTGLPDTTTGHKALVVDVNGKVYTAPYGGGGSDSTLYKVDDSLHNTDRTVDLKLHNLEFKSDVDVTNQTNIDMGAGYFASFTRNTVVTGSTLANNADGTGNLTGIDYVAGVENAVKVDKQYVELRTLYEFNDLKYQQFRIDTLSGGVWKNTWKHTGIDYSGVNFANFQDSTLVPKKWVVDNFAPISGSGVTSFNTRTGAVTLTSGDVTGALTFTPYNATNPSNYIALTALSATSPIFYNNSTGVISSQAATTSLNGYLTSTDWNTFNGKQAALVSGTNIKTVNSNSLLGSGNVAVGDALVANPLSQFASTTSSQLAGVISDETGGGAAVFGTTPTLATPVINGLPTGTGVASAATASTIVARDANANATINSLIENGQSITSAAGTTTLTGASPKRTMVIGSTTQTIVLPVVSTLVLYQQFYIINNSTGIVTVQSSGANTVATLGAGVVGTFTCQLITGTSAASWDSKYGSGGAAGSDKQVQYNNSGALTGSSNFMWDYTNNRLGLNTTPASTLDLGNNFNSSLYTFRTGSFLIQPMGLNNIAFADNAYFNGSQYTRLNTGSAIGFQFFGQSLLLFGASSGNAGTTFTATYGFQYTPSNSNSVAMGGTVPIQRPWTGASLIVLGDSGDAFIRGDTRAQGGIDFGKVANPTTTSITPSSSGGTLSAATYYYKLVAVDSYGNETGPSTEISTTTTGSTGSVSIVFPSVTGAVSYRMYQGPSSDGESKYFTGSSSPMVDIGSGYTTKVIPIFNLTTYGGVSSTGTVNLSTLTASKVVFTGASKNLTSTGIGTSSQLIAGDGSLVTSTLPIHGNSTTTGTATTVVTVTIGQTMANTTYDAGIDPQDLVTAVNWFISAKTTTTFDVTFVSALTGSISFDWHVIP
jgi:hypothetical protein